jgi:signal transduction histidine kinase/CheY-like chemotaxis protein
MPGRASIDALVQRFLPPMLRDAETDVLRRAKVCILFTLSIAIWGPGFAVFLWAMGLPLIGSAVGLATLVTPVPLLALRRTGSLALTGHFIAAITYVMIVGCTWLEGGLGAPGVNWFPLVPVVAMLIVGQRAGILWTVAMVVALVGYYLLGRIGVRPEIGLGAESLLVLHLALSASAVALFAFLGTVFESLKADALRSLESANRELVSARDLAEAGTRAKSDFLAMMSHEIRTPLHGIFGMTDLALDTDDDTERREFLHRTRACAETLLSVINDVLDFSRIEANRLVLEEAVFEPRAVVEGVLDTLATQAAAKGLELVGWVDERVPERLIGDAGRLRQILINLGGNAVKFTDRGEVMIVLGAAPDGVDAGDDFVLRGFVRDTGCGIPQDKQAAIFEPFTQVASWETSRHGGTGLGLAITRRLVELMGGEVSLESEPGSGSAFWFTARFQAAGEALVAVPALPGLRVLVVDENTACRCHLAYELWAAVADPVAAADAAEAAQLLADDAGAFDAVILGLPPGAAGRVDRIRQVRALRQARNAPCVVLVHGTRSALAATLPELASVISKPVKRGAFLAALRAATRPECALPRAAAS